MRKLLYITVFFISQVTCNAAYAQSRYFDSLRMVLSNQANDTNKVKTLIKLSDALEVGAKTDSSFVCCDSALALANKLGYKWGQSMAYRLMGFVYEDKGDYKNAFIYQQKCLDVCRQMGTKSYIASAMGNMGILYHEQGNQFKAIEYDSTALSISAQINDKDGMGRYCVNLGIVYNDIGQYAKSIDMHLKALGIYKQLNNKEGIAANYVSIGNVYDREANFAKAIENDYKALGMFKEIDDTRGQMSCYCNIGAIYQEQDNNTKALEYYLKALPLSIYQYSKIPNIQILDNIGDIYILENNYSKAMVYKNEVLTTSSDMGYKEGIANALNGMGEIYMREAGFFKNNSGNIEMVGNTMLYGNGQDSAVARAMGYYTKAESVCKQASLKNQLIEAMNNIGEAYIFRKKYGLAKQYLDSSLVMSSAIGDKQDMEEVYRSLILIDSAKGDNKRVDTDRKEYLMLKDSILNADGLKKIAEAETGFINEMKSDSLKAVSEKDAEIKNGGGKRTEILTWAIVSAILTLFLYMFFRNRIGKNNR